VFHIKNCYQSFYHARLVFDESTKWAMDEPDRKLLISRENKFIIEWNLVLKTTANIDATHLK